VQAWVLWEVPERERRSLGGDAVALRGDTAGVVSVQAHGDVLDLGVVLEGGEAFLAAVAALLVAAEWGFFAACEVFVD
jgi:hypothetical protein